MHFGGLALGCIEADFWKFIFICRIFSSPDRSAHFCTALISEIQKRSVKLRLAKITFNYFNFWFERRLLSRRILWRNVGLSWTFEAILKQLERKAWKCDRRAISTESIRLQKFCSHCSRWNCFATQHFQKWATKDPARAVFLEKEIVLELLVGLTLTASVTSTGKVFPIFLSYFYRILDRCAKCCCVSAASRSSTRPSSGG